MLEQEPIMLLWNPIVFSLLPLFFYILFFLTKWLSNIITPEIAHKNPPPSPTKLPIIGNLHQLGCYPHRSLQSMALKHGPLMLLHLGSVPVLVVSSAVAAREVLKTHDLIFSNRPKSSITRRLFYGPTDVAFSPYGKYWKQIRSISVLQLLSNKRVQSFQSVREEETRRMIEKITESCSSSSPVNLSEMFVSLTNNIVCRVALGRKYNRGEGGRKFMELLGTFLEVLGTFNVEDYIPWLAWLNRINGFDGKLDKVAKEIDQLLEGIVEEHMISQNQSESERKSNGSGGHEGERPQDFVDVLLEIQRDKKAGSLVDRDNIKAVILDMFVAGTDTIYTTLDWTMAELLRHSKIMKKLQNEVKEIARGKLNITEEDLEKMYYLKAVIKESLRLHTPLPLLVPRESTQDVKVMGYDILAGTQVLINAWAISRDPFSWEDPDEFQPERFLNNSIDVKGNDYELIPFGAGRRGCPGTLFAMNVSELALANVVHKFEFSLPNGSIEKDLDMKEATGITIHRKNPLLVIATPYCST
ncbi:Cytochrome P450 71A4 [Camellia lanceoleosa]|uniref:Cytochrome P450 71A4 n=1 Tax=Camellia lanceoleosa TaxID=1840588 RepID=A0ACC0I767_9ERIC|nr:Cytochrome P450 71A4 [Camellia lanceoleosa]